eukprot:gene10360-biopygen12311
MRAMRPTSPAHAMGVALLARRPPGTPQHSRETDRARDRYPAFVHARCGRPHKMWRGRGEVLSGSPACIVLSTEGGAPLARTENAREGANVDPHVPICSVCLALKQSAPHVPSFPIGNIIRCSAWSSVFFCGNPPELPQQRFLGGKLGGKLFSYFGGGYGGLPACSALFCQGRGNPHRRCQCAARVDRRAEAAAGAAHVHEAVRAPRSSFRIRSAGSPPCPCFVPVIPAPRAHAHRRRRARAPLPPIPQNVSGAENGDEGVDAVGLRAAVEQFQDKPPYPETAPRRPGEPVEPGGPGRPGRPGRPGGPWGPGCAGAPLFSTSPHSTPPG